MNRQQLTRHLVLTLATAALVAAPLAARGGMLDSWFNKKGEGERPVSARFDREPSLVFDGGKLGVDLAGRWRLGGSSLVFTGASRCWANGREIDGRSLRMGQEARVTGTRLADGSVAVKRLRLVGENRQIKRLGIVGGTVRPVGEAPRGGPR